jgi:transcriptional accessory protein Tex/SPT6
MLLFIHFNSVFILIAGFRNGCKIGITSCSGSVLATDVIYPPFSRQMHPDSDSSALKLRDLVVKYK